MQDSNLLWQLHGLAFSHGRQPVFNSLDLAIERGCCYGILGPNGSGKTTLLDMLSGLLPPSQGTIHFCGKPLAGWSCARLARRVGMVPQQFVVRFGFSVRDVVAMGRHPHLGRFAVMDDRDEALIAGAMDVMGIAALADRQVTQLSGGEQQRVAVARALAQDTEVLLLDEATSNLDVYHSLSILSTLRGRMKEQGLTIVAALHDLNQAAFFCDRLLFVKQGRLVCEGPVDKVLRSEIIKEVYGVEARVRHDDFANCRQVSFRSPGEKR